jgi:predicted secreted hydrolase
LKTSLVRLLLAGLIAASFALSGCVTAGQAENKDGSAKIPSSQTVLPYVDDLTKQNVAQALWMKDYDEGKIPRDILDKLYSEKNSNQAFGARFKTRLQQLVETRLSFVPSREDRYKYLMGYTSSQSPQQSYANLIFLGPESSVGYKTIPANPQFPFPATDRPQWEYQTGWHFFVGNFTDAQGNHYSVQMMFWQYALLPAEQASRAGLSEIENQIVEMHLAVTDAATGSHYRANNIIAAGTTGLINFTSVPYAYTLGKNGIVSLAGNGDMFPLRLTARGWDMGKTPHAEIEINLSLKNDKGYFLQGDLGAAPSIDGLGTLYYSAADLKLVDKAEQAITINGKKTVLTEGRVWYDHQWGNGFMPGGAPEHAVMRAAQVMTPPPPGGWNWFMMQFSRDDALSKEGEVQMAISALHTRDNLKFLSQTGPEPPGVMTASFFGKYIDAANKTHELKGTLEIPEWVKANSSPNPAVYFPTGTWYPAKYAFKVEGEVPEALKNLTVKPLVQVAQTGFFASGLEYLEGGSIIYDSSGKEIGRGFIEGTNYSYAGSKDTVLSLAKLPKNETTLKLFNGPEPSWWDKLTSALYVFFDKNELQQILDEARGM